MSEIANGNTQFNRLPVVWSYRRAGWTHLHPILPPLPVDKHRLWQLQSYHGWSDEHARKEWARRFGGKCPGAMDENGNWFPISAQAADLYQEIDGGESTRLGRACLRAWEHGAGIGVNAGWCQAIDVDLRDTGQAEAVRELLRVLFQHRPASGIVSQFYWRVGMPPKGLMPFRLAAGAEAVRKVVLDVGRDRVEVLGHGLQWVLEGTHGGTGRPYEWVEPPVVEHLPVISLLGLQRLLETIGDVLELPAAVSALGRVRVSRSDGYGGEGGGVPAADLLGPEDLVLETLRDGHPNRTMAVSRDRWVATGHAMRGASGGSDWGRSLWRRWSRQHPQWNEADDERLWVSARAPRTGIVWLIEEAMVSAGVKVGWLERLATWRSETRAQGSET